ncbi:MAG: YciI family protein [Anaerolineales bacterium]
MPNYILAYYSDGKMPASPEEGAKGRAKFQDWIRDLGDAVVNPGTPLGMSKTVSANGAIGEGGANRLTGFSVVKAKSLEAAVELAKGCPFLDMGTIDVAEVMEM